MRFEVLGPLRVRTDDGEVAIRQGRERVLLAVLLLRAGTTVSVEHLVDALWPEAPPHSARNQVQACVSRLRRRLADAGMSGDVIVTDPSGYRLQIDQGSIDVHQFRAHLENARNEVAHGRRREARDSYRAAIGLWRGPALADLDSPAVRQAAAALDEEQTQALVERIEVELALGQAGELIGELTELAQRNPYREALHASLRPPEVGLRCVLKCDHVLVV